MQWKDHYSKTYHTCLVRLEDINKGMAGASPSQSWVPFPVQGLTSGVPQVPPTQLFRRGKKVFVGQAEVWKDQPQHQYWPGELVRKKGRARSKAPKKK
jgi:hypothetical protein